MHFMNLMHDIAISVVVIHSSLTLERHAVVMLLYTYYDWQGVEE
jgi:hypothetical protein